MQTVSFTSGNAENGDLGAIGFLDGGGEPQHNPRRLRRAKHLGSGAATTGAYGFLLAEASDYNTVQNCQALSVANVSTTPEGTLGAGFAFGYSLLLSFYDAVAVDTTVRNCWNQGITTVPGGAAYGFYVTQCQTGYIQNCVALDSGNGFFLDIESSNFTLEGCEAGNNEESGFTDQSGNGGTTATNVLKKNKASFNGTDPATGRIWWCRVVGSSSGR